MKIADSLLTKYRPELRILFVLCQWLPVPYRPEFRWKFRCLGRVRPNVSKFRSRRSWWRRCMCSRERCRLKRLRRIDASVLGCVIRKRFMMRHLVHFMKCFFGACIFRFMTCFWCIFDAFYPCVLWSIMCCASGALYSSVLWYDLRGIFEGFAIKLFSDKDDKKVKHYVNTNLSDWR